MKHRIGLNAASAARCGLAALSALALLAGAAAAAERPPIEITDPRAKTYRAATQRFRADAGPDLSEASRVIVESLEKGLVFSGLFSNIAPRAFLGPVESPRLDARDTGDCNAWLQIGSDALVQGAVGRDGDGLKVEFQVFDVVSGCKRMLRKRYRGEWRDARRMGKAIADDIVERFTGSPGVSDTEIAFVSDRGGNKEIYVMDADGGSLRRATNNGSINSFPDWSPNGEAIVYTTYRYRNRPWLFLLTRGKKSPGRILRDLNGSGPMYRGVFDPGGKRLALVKSVDGATEIFAVGRGGSNLRRLTKHRAIDVSPSWSPDGRRLAFVSDRTGSPQVYVMNEDGSGQRRLTFNGSYNTAPTWSPDGRWIAYETRVGGQFDIWLIDPDGQTNAPLVTHRRGDENPTWSPDGRKLAFSSKRRGRADIWVVDVTGKNLVRITDGGENTTPAWGPFRR